MRALALPLLAAALVAGCGSDESSPSSESAPSSVLTTEDNSLTVETTEPKPTASQIRRAERAAREDKPDAPIWEGVRYTGHEAGPGKVCVDQVMSKEDAELLGGNGTSHVVVTIPEYGIGEAKEGACDGSNPKPKAKPEKPSASGKAIVRERRFFLKMDDLAIQLDDAISTFQHGGSAARIGELRGRILDAVNEHLLDGGDTSIGANLLLSAATTARNEARKGDPLSPRLADQHNEIADARARLAEDAIG